VQNTVSSNLLSQNVKIKIHRTVMLSVVLYGCEVWSLTFREEHRLRNIFGLRRDEVKGEWRRLHKELYDLYSSPNIIWVIKSRKLRWRGHGAYGGRERCIQDFGGET
jgi:hypothetical protein